MPGGQIDRDAWAREVQELIVRFDPGPRGVGNKSAFARRVGLTTKTLERWAARTVEVSLESVRRVGEALGFGEQEQVDLLNRIGYFAAAKLPPRPAPEDPRDDPVIKQILADPRWSDDERVELVQAQLDVMKADMLRRQAEYDRLIRHLRGNREAS